jgi:hypothetical protein
MKCDVEGVKEFLRSSKYGRTRRREIMKGIKEMREGM